MVTISVDGDVLDIQVVGRHKFWALTSSLRVPLSDVREVRRLAGNVREEATGSTSVHVRTRSGCVAM